MSRPPAPRRRRRRRRIRPAQWLAVLAVCALPVPLGLAAAYGTGYPPARVTLAGGTAWLASPGQGLVTLVDGPSEQVVGSVRVRDVGDVGDVVQVGSSALLLDREAGSVRRLSGATYDVSAPLPVAAAGGLSVLTGRTVAYVMDTARHTVSSLDADSLTESAKVRLSAVPGPGQAVVDTAERLWVVDGVAGGLSGLAPDAAGAADDAVGAPVAAVRSSAVGPTARLTLVEGRAAVVDPIRGAAGLVGDDAGVDRWACFPGADTPGTQLLGSTTGPRLYAAVPETGKLLIADLDAGRCPAEVSVGRPGERLGPLVESNGFVLVPNETTGRLAAVDVGALDVGVPPVPEELPVLPNVPSRLELVAKDGLVFYNDLAGERAGVIRFDGDWQVAYAGDKYRVSDGQPANELASGAGEIPPDVALPAPPSRAPVGGAARPQAVPPAGGRAPAVPLTVPAPAPPPPTEPTTEPTTDLTPTWTAPTTEPITPTTGPSVVVDRVPSPSPVSTPPRTTRRPQPSLIPEDVIPQTDPPAARRGGATTTARPRQPQLTPAPVGPLTPAT